MQHHYPSLMRNHCHPLSLYLSSRQLHLSSKSSVLNNRLLRLFNERLRHQHLPLPLLQT